MENSIKSNASVNENSNENANENLNIINKVREDKNAEIQDQLIKMVARQTEYSYEEAKEKLIIYNNDYITVIKEFMNIDNKKIDTTKTTNQQIYREIRNLMDDAATNYRKQQEYNKVKAEYNKIINAKKQFITEQANKKIQQLKETGEKE